SRTQIIEVLDFLLEVVLQPFDDAGLQLAGALFGDVVLPPEVIERQGRIGQDAVTEDVFITLTECLGEGCKFGSKDRPELAVRKLFIRGRSLSGEDVEEGAVRVLAEGLIEREFPASKPLGHLDQVALTNVQPARHAFGRGTRGPPSTA